MNHGTDTTARAPRRRCDCPPCRTADTPGRMLNGRDAIGVDLDARNRDLLPRRMDECRKALFGVAPELPGQLSLMDAE